MDKKSIKPTIPGGKRNYRTAIFFVLVAFFGLIIFNATGTTAKLKEVPFSQVISKANAGEIRRLEVSCNDITITKKGEDKASEKSQKEAGSSIYEQGLTNRDLDVSIKNPNCASSAWTSVGINLLPIVFLGLFLMYGLRVSTSVDTGDSSSVISPSSPALLSEHTAT